MAKLYYARFNDNGYDMIISDDGELRRVLTDDKYPEMTNMKPEDVLKSVEDDSSWEQYEESVEELTKDCEILAETEF